MPIFISRLWERGGFYFHSTQTPAKQDGLIKKRVQQLLHAETLVLHRFNIHPDLDLSFETKATGQTGRRMGLVINRQFRN